MDNVDGQTDNLNGQKSNTSGSLVDGCFSDLADLLPIGILILDTRQTIEYCNQTVREMLSYSKANLLGKHISALFDPKGIEIDPFNPRNSDFFCGHVKLEHSCTTADGMEMPVIWTFIPANRNKNGKCNTICCIDHAPVMYGSFTGDEHYDKKHIKSFDEEEVAVVIIQDFVIKYVNKTLTDLLGYEESEILDKNFIEFIYDESKEAAYQLYLGIDVASWLQKNPEFKVVTKSGDTIALQVTLSVVEYNGTAADKISLRRIPDYAKGQKNYQNWSGRLKASWEIIRRKLDMEKTISHISSSLVAPQDIDLAIDECLKDIGYLCGACRVYLFMLIDEETLSNTHEWCNEDVEAQIDNLKNLPTSTIPWWMEKLRAGEVINISDVPSMPPEAHNEKKILEMQDIRSVIVLPLYVNGEISGFVGMDNVVNTIAWDKGDINVLNILSNLLGSAIGRKRNEEALRLRTQELEKAYAELKTLDKMKNEFISNLSHELKTPLHNIYGHSSLLSDGVLDELNEGQKRSVDTMVNNSVRLGTLIDSMLFMSNVLAGTVRYTFDIILVETALTNILETYSTQAEKKGLHISKKVHTTLPFIEADAIYIVKMLEKIMDNAIKFTPKDGTIVLHAYKEDDFVHIEVKDNGIGISKDNIPNIFDSFYQVDGSSTRKYGGNGLGLYIARLIVNGHHGKIWVESEKGMGTTVHVLLPEKQPKVV